MGNLDKIVKPDTKSINYGYDLVDRLTGIDYPAGETDVSLVTTRPATGLRWAMGPGRAAIATTAWTS